MSDISCEHRVNYTISQADVDKLNAVDVPPPFSAMRWRRPDRRGAGVSVGNVFPFNVEKVNNDGSVNGRVWLTNGNMFVVNVREGTTPGTWAWPPGQ